MIGYDKEKPKRPYKSLLDYRTQWRFDHCPKSEWPCLECDGRGKIYDPDDEPDVVEGNKFRGRIKCQHCKGTGIGSESGFREAYDKILADYEAKVFEWNRLRHIWTHITLSEDEIESIVRFGLPQQ